MLPGLPQAARVSGKQFDGWIRCSSSAILSGSVASRYFADGIALFESGSKFAICYLLFVMPRSGPPRPTTRSLKNLGYI
jgi:hypothetical protein